MKKLIILILALGLIGGLGYIVYTLQSNEGKSFDAALDAFSYKDVSNIDRIAISNDLGQHITLVKENDSWTDENGMCISPFMMENVLDALQKIEFKGFVQDGATEQYKRMMTSKHTKVEIYQNGEWHKTWYIGPNTSDHYGQVMLLDSKEHGRFDQPVIMHIKGVHGIIEPRFVADPLQWRCTGIFALDIKDIQQVKVTYTQEPERSFSVTKSGSHFDVKQNGQMLSGVDTTMILAYLQKYKKINYEMPNYVLDKAQVDSLKKTQPFCIMNVQETSGKKTQLKLHYINTQMTFTDELGRPVNRDIERFWCVLPDGGLVKCQFFVFNPLLLGHMYFPLRIEPLMNLEAGPTKNTY